MFSIRLTTFRNERNIQEGFQSGFREDTEAAPAEMICDLRLGADVGRISFLVLIDST